MTMAATTCVRSGGGQAGSKPNSRGSSPGSTGRSVVGSYSLANVPVEWDNQPSIRERIRENNNLCLTYDYEKGEGVSGYVDATIDNLRLNCAVLEPLALLMRDHELQLPSIEALICAVQEFFQLAKLSRSADHCYQEAWSLRRMIGKLKRFTYRTTPPQDRWFI